MLRRLLPTVCALCAVLILSLACIALRSNRPLPRRLPVTEGAGNSVSASPVRLALFQDRGVGGWSLDAPLVSAPRHNGHESAACFLSDVQATEGEKRYVSGYTIQYLYGAFAVTAQPFHSLVFYIHGGSAGGQKFNIVSRLADSDWRGYRTLPLFAHPEKYLEGGLNAIPPGRWVKVTVPLADLGLAGRNDLHGLSFVNAQTGRQPVFYLSDMALEGAVPAEAVVTVDAGAAVRRVNAHLFGICTYGVPTADNGRDVLAAKDAGYHLQRAFYPTFNQRPGMVPNPQRGLLFAASTGADALACVNYCDMEADVPAQKQRTFGTPQEAAALVAYANAPLNARSAAMPLGKDAYGRDWGTVGEWADLRAGKGSGVIGGRDYGSMRIGHPAPFGVRLWELDNEPWMHARDTDWLGYANFCKQADALMRKAVPDFPIQTGVTLVGGGDPGTPRREVTNPATGAKAASYDDNVLAYLSGQDQTLSPGRLVPDFIVWHWYWGTDTGPTADLATLLTYQSASSDWKQIAQNLRRRLGEYYGGEQSAASRHPYFLVTENNIRSTFPLNKQTRSLVSALYLADDLGQLLQSKQNDFEGLTWHDWDDGDLNKGGYLENPALYGWRREAGYGVYGSHAQEGSQTRYPVHYAFKLLSRCLAHQDDTVVTAASSAPLLAAYAVRQQGGNLAVLLINKAATAAVRVRFALQGYTPAPQVTRCSYGEAQERIEGDIDLAPLRWQPGQSVSVPPYSLTVLTFTQAGATASARTGAASSAQAGVWPLTPPTLLTALPGDNKIVLRWTAMTGAESYDVYRGVNGHAPTLYRRGVTDCVFVDQGRDAAFTPGARYAYRVIARRGAGASLPSSEAEALLAPRPGAVTALVAHAADRQVTLTWNPVPGAQRYIVRRADSAPSAFRQIADYPYRRNLDQSITRTVYNDRGLRPNIPCRYQVRALNGAGEGPPTDVMAVPNDSRFGAWQALDLAGRDDGATIWDAHNQTFALEGSGTVWYGSGQGRFVYQTLHGDGTLTARVLSVIGHGLYGKNTAGLMLRETLDAHSGARFAFLGLTPPDSGYGLAFLTSANQGGVFESEAGVPADQRQAAPYWLRLERRGDLVTAAYASDGMTWHTYRSETFAGLPADLYIGLNVNSMTYFATAKSVFDHVRLAAHTPAP